MKRYGLIGKTLRHSWSQQWFSSMFAREGITNAEYTLYELPSVDGLKQWMLQKGINGLNVTIPYKEAVLPLLDRLDSEAQSIGAVNCIKVVDGQLEGYNTDAPAFAHSLQPLLQSWHSRALVLGTGGASKAVTHALLGLGIDCTLVSRHPELHPGAVSYTQAESLAAQCLLIVNTTPAGMFPLTDASPWTHFEVITTRHLCYDLIYNPSETLFMQQAKARGAQTIGGLDMLHRQAALSWDIWQK